MSDLQTNVQINLTGTLARNARAYGQAMDRFTGRAVRGLGNLRRAAGGVSNTIDRLGNRYTGLATGGAFALAARGVVDFDAKLKEVEVQAGLTADQVAALKMQLFDVAQSSDVRLDPRELLAAFDAIIEKTGDFDLASDNLKNLGIAIRASGASGRDIGAVVAGFAKLDIKAPAEVAQALEILVEQGKAGAFTMKDFAREAGPMLASMAAMGQDGLTAIKTMGALAQTTQMATDSASETGTAFSALIRDIVAKAKILQENGVQVYDPEAMKQGREEFRELGSIVTEIITQSQGQLSKLQTIFGDESQKAVKVLAAEFAKTGDLKILEGFQAIDGTTGQLIDDAAAKASTMSASIDSLNAALSRLSNENLSAPIQSIADALNSLDSSELNTLFNVAATGVTAAAGIWAVNKAVRGVSAGVRAVSSLRGGKGVAGGKGAGGAAGSALSAAMAQPVFVTNWPVGMGGVGMGGDGDKKGRGRGRGGLTGGGRSGALGRGGHIGKHLAGMGQSVLQNRFVQGAGSVGSRLLRGSAPVAVVMGASTMINAASTGDTREMAGAGGAIGGALAGGKLGAIGGTVFGPAGTVVGGLVGAGAGALVGEEGARKVYDWITGWLSDDATSATDRLARSIDEQTRAMADNTTELRRQPKAMRVGVDFEAAQLNAGSL